MTLTLTMPKCFMVRQPPRTHPLDLSPYLAAITTNGEQSKVGTEAGRKRKRLMKRRKAERTTPLPYPTEETETESEEEQAKAPTSEKMTAAMADVLKTGSSRQANSCPGSVLAPEKIVNELTKTTSEQFLRMEDCRKLERLERPMKEERLRENEEKKVKSTTRIQNGETRLPQYSQKAAERRP